jgi:hypothetical protein
VIGWVFSVNHDDKDSAIFVRHEPNLEYVDKIVKLFNAKLNGNVFIGSRDTCGHTAGHTHGAASRRIFATRVK